MIFKCFSDMSFKTKNKFSKVTLVTVFSTEYDETYTEYSMYKFSIQIENNFNKITDFFLF